MPPNPSQILTGSDGEIYALDDGELLADVPRCRAEVQITNLRHRAMFDRHTIELHDEYSVTLTFTQTLITDKLLARFRDAYESRRQLSLDFQCKLTSQDGRVHRSFFYNCVPTGTVTILDFAPGDVMNRDWSFYVNGKWDMQEELG